MRRKGKVAWVKLMGGRVHGKRQAGIKKTKEFQLCFPWKRKVTVTNKSRGLVV